MAKQRRSFSVDQKLQIIQEADQHGVSQTLRKYNLSHTVYLRWKTQFNQGGVQSLKPQYHTVDPELRALQDENARLKKIIGNTVNNHSSILVSDSVHSDFISFDYDIEKAAKAVEMRSLLNAYAESLRKGI